MGQVNELCESIGSAANQLLHPPSGVWRHVDLRHQDLLRDQLELLQDRETGPQRLLQDTLSQPHGVSDQELDRWIRMKLQEFGELSAEAADAAATLARFL